MRALILILPLLAAAGAARAEAAPRPLTLTPYRAEAPRPDPRAAVALRSPLAAAVLPPGVARTSVDHRFDRAGLVGSAGFLCGLQPGLDDGGSAGVTGHDPHGRFVGAKLSLAF